MRIAAACSTVFSMASKGPSIPPWSTVEEIAERYDAGMRTVYRWLADGLFPNAYREHWAGSSRWLIPARDVRAFRRPVSGRRKTHGGVPWEEPTFDELELELEEGVEELDGHKGYGRGAA